MSDVFYNCIYLPAFSQCLCLAGESVATLNNPTLQQRIYDMSRRTMARRADNSRAASHSPSS